MNEESKFDMVVKKQRILHPKSNKYDDNEFAIVSCKLVKISDENSKKPKLHPQYKNLTIKGNLPFMEDNVEYRVVATEEYNSERKSYSYNVIYLHEVLDMGNERNQRAFLERILSPNQVFNLFQKFDKPMDVLVNGDREALLTVKGVGEKTINNLINRFNKTKDYAPAYVKLTSYNISNNLIDKLIKHYSNPDEIVKIVETNPYQFASEVKGIGFKIADEIALKSGHSKHSINRCLAFIRYYLNEEAMQNGNSYISTHDIRTEISDVLGVDYPVDNIKKSLVQLLNKNEIWTSNDRKQIGLRSVYEVELSVAKNLIRTKEAIPKDNLVCDEWLDKVKQLEQQQGWEYTDEQHEAIKGVIENNVVLITGNAGSGKTTVVNAMLKALNDGVKFSQCALSGRAGVNLTNATGHESYTIHRLLGYDGNSYFYNSNEKLETDIVILDELSMVDATLSDKLIQSIESGSKMIMLGDDGQLESIGVGNIIYDLIQTKVIKHYHLTKVHRQASKSAIITESRKIRNSIPVVDSSFSGEMTLGELQDLTLIGYHENPNREVGSVKPTMLKMFERFKKRLKQADDNVMDVCCMLPTKTSGSSCYKLNRVIQKYLIDTDNTLSVVVNGSKDYGYSIYVGDKVICNSNKMDAGYYTGEVDEFGEKIKQIRPIYNGNMGIITEIDNDYITVDFDGIGLIHVDRSDSNILELGYCITVHRLQGSSCKFIICGLDNSHFIMLTRELVYTMWTRTKFECDFIFETSAFNRAVKTSNIGKKRTFLPMFLTGVIEI